jgi:sugar O-acyltransferase (sialic acid O-acetyltransferase NeuD family)
MTTLTRTPVAYKLRGSSEPLGRVTAAMDCVLYGVGSTYVHEVYEILRRRGWHICGLVANLADAPRPEHLGPVVRPPEMPPEWLECGAVLPVVTPGHIQRLRREAYSRGFRQFPALVDPTAVVAESAAMGEGTVINAGVVIGAESRFGVFTSVNRSVSVGHHAVVADYVSLGPACVLSGEVRLERGAFVGAGATLLPGVRIGSNAVVGAGSVVVNDVPSNTVIVGNPGRVIREGNPGYNGVEVLGDDEEVQAAPWT